MDKRDDVAVDASLFNADGLRSIPGLRRDRPDDAHVQGYRCQRLRVGLHPHLDWLGSLDLDEASRQMFARPVHHHCYLCLKDKNDVGCQ